MLTENSSIVKIFLASLITTAITLAYFDTGNILILALIAVLFSIVITSSAYVVLLSTFICGYIVLSMLNELLVMLVLIIAVFFATIYYISRGETRSPGNTIVNTFLIFIPVNILQPRTLLLGLASFISMVSLTIHEYLRISRSTASLIVTNPTVYLGEYANVVVEITCPGRFEYLIIVDDDQYERGVARDSIVVNVKKTTTRLGLHKHVVKIEIRGEHRLAKIYHGPFVVEYTVVAKFMELYRRAERILKEYNEYLSIPLVLKANTLILESPIESKTGEVAPGFNIQYPVVETITREGRKYIDREGTGSRGDEAYYKLVEASIMGGDHRSSDIGKTLYRLKLSWKIPQWYMERIVLPSKGRLGEYIGIREFNPGDSLKLIHWKKSLRREDIMNLIVKIYSMSDIEETAKKTRHIVISDLTATNSMELDLILQSLYSHILATIYEEKHDSIRRTEFYIYLIMPKGEAFLIYGKPLDVLLALNKLIMEEKVTALFEYQSWDRTSLPFEKEPTGLVQELFNYYQALGTALVKDLRSKGVEKGSVVFIYSKALSFKYFAISYTFANYGYIVATPKIRENKKMS